MRADRNCRYPRLLAVVAALIMLAAAAAAQNPDATYAELVKKAQAGDSSVDFRALRLACADAKKCDATDRDDLVAMRKASQAKDYKKAAKLAEKSIERGFPNIEAHATAAEAYKALKETDKAEFHHAITGALIRSIMKTGDGKTKETAFEVISVDEEHIVLNVLGLPVFGRQSLISGKPHSYDLIEVDAPNGGGKVSVYFNIDAFFPMKGFNKL